MSDATISAVIASNLREVILAVLTDVPKPSEVTVAF